ncbi:MAG: hypothetical protein Q7U54_10315 [Bacteroidales bacterium]|nr:hypothetical protein [Bacteroidales bacterium]
MVERKATREIVNREIQFFTADLLPRTGYDRVIFPQKVDATFHYFYELAQLGSGVAA